MPDASGNPTAAENLTEILRQQRQQYLSAVLENYNNTLGQIAAESTEQFTKLNQQQLEEIRNPQLPASFGNLKDEQLVISAMRKDEGFFKESVEKAKEILKL